MYEQTRLNWSSRDYFTMLLNADERSGTCLEMFVDDLHASKDRTIRAFLDHSGSEDFLWGLAKLLGHQNCRVSGNAAYIIGTLAESETGCSRVVTMATSANPDGQKILPYLNNMLLFDDCESVMNAAGTMGTLAESVEGRAWILQDVCFQQLMDNITKLLFNENLWIASNAALVLARLSIAEDGCMKILKHNKSEQILSMLITSLGVDEAGRGMNSAFAIGRLCDLEAGRNRLLAMIDSEKMILCLGKMLACSDSGASKNACFALSCLATSTEGHGRILACSHSDSLLKSLSELLSASDNETAWFSAMTLRTLASLPGGCLRLRRHSDVMNALKAIDCKSHFNTELTEEVIVTLNILKTLDKPATPKAEVLGAHSVKLSWEESTTSSGLDINYHLYEGSRLIYHGPELECTAEDLDAYTQYSFKLRALTEGDDSPFSNSITVTTDESVPEAPEQLKIIGCTTTQLKVSWEPPQQINGILKGYYVHYGSNAAVAEYTNDVGMIITGLQPNTTYDVQVCAATSKGKGPIECVSGSTSETGAHAPSKPEVIVRGRHELHIQWRPPEVPLGRISRYDLSMNGEVVYSGTELHYTVLRLRPGTEYIFIVSAITSEGRCESKPAKKKTAKDEYDVDRAPLYPEPDMKEMPTKMNFLKKRKSIAGLPHSISDPCQPVTSARSASASSVKPPTAGHRRPKSAKKRTIALKTVRRQSIPVIPSDVVEKNEKGTDQAKLPSDLARIVKSQNIKPSIPESLTNRMITSDKAKLDVHQKSKPVTPKRESVSNRPEREGFIDGENGDNISEYKEAAPVVEKSSEQVSKKSDQLGNKALCVAGQKQRAMAICSLFDGQEEEVRSREKGTGARTEGKRQGKLQGKQMEVTNGKRGEGILQRRHETKQNGRSRSKAESRCETRESTKLNEKLEGRKDGGTEVKHEGRLNGQLKTEDMEKNREDERPHSRQLGDSSFNLHSKRTSFPVENVGSGEECTKRLSGYIELDLGSTAVASRKDVGNNCLPAYVQRAKTFMAHHRPSTSRRHLQKLQSCLNSTLRWQPDIPTNEHVQATHNKFVPMQMRTQPLNLPGGDIGSLNSHQAVALNGMFMNRQSSFVAAGGAGRGRLDGSWPGAGSRRDGVMRQRATDHTISLSPVYSVSAQKVLRNEIQKNNAEI